MKRIVINIYYYTPIYIYKYDLECVQSHTKNVCNKCNTSPQLSEPHIFKNNVPQLPILLDGCFAAF